MGICIPCGRVVFQLTGPVGERIDELAVESFLFVGVRRIWWDISGFWNLFLGLTVLAVVLWTKLNVQSPGDGNSSKGCKSLRGNR